LTVGFSREPMSLLLLSALLRKQKPYRQRRTIPFRNVRRCLF